MSPSRPNGFFPTNQEVKSFMLLPYPSYECSGDGEALPDLAERGPYTSIHCLLLYENEGIHSAFLNLLIATLI